MRRIREVLIVEIAGADMREWRLEMELILLISFIKRNGAVELIVGIATKAVREREWRREDRVGEESYG